MSYIPAQQPPYAPSPAAPYFQPQQAINAQPQPLIISQQPVVMAAGLGDTPVRMICPNCQNDVITQTSSEVTPMQHCAFFIMFLIGLWCCSCIPYCIDSLKNVRHECPRCNSHLGTHRK